jgi:long-subunit acyl-CoA synthetase (AMP-forming)
MKFPRLGQRIVADRQHDRYLRAIRIAAEIPAWRRPMRGDHCRRRGTEVRGTTGILVRGPIVMQGYCNKPARLKALRGGWLHTGDAAIMDEEGLIYIVDWLKT